MSQEANELNLCKGLEKAIIEAQHKNKDIIFGNDTAIYRELLNELIKQQIINKRVQNQKLGITFRKKKHISWLSHDGREEKR